MKNVYLEKKTKKDCNGCGTCALICPKQCIHMEEDEEGFLYPIIDEEKCIHCNRCKKICSNYNINREYKSKAYITINKNDEERRNSASGGMFFILANYIIEKNGVVFGAKYDENLVVRHDYAETLADCKKFSGSKYVRSDITGIYEKVKLFLKENRYVLFTGTPCQCSGLKTYLDVDYENLILCDIICHANPSPKVFKKYIEEKEKIEQNKIQKIDFRSKENGWDNSTPIIEYIDGKKEEDNIFYKSFINELFNRPSCHTCPFASKIRQTDFTIGDLWGINNIEPMMNDNKGTSLLLINSLKAQKIFKEINKKMDYKDVDIDLAFSYNHNKPVEANKNRQKFFNYINKNNNDIIIKYMNKYTKVSFWKKLKKKLINYIKLKKKV